MKYLITLLGALIATCSFGQFAGIQVEEVDNKGIVPGKTYRVYVVVKSPNDQLCAVYGYEQNELKVESTEPFFQSEYGAHLASNAIRKTASEQPELLYDSWVTIGAEDNYNNAVNSFLMEFDEFEAGSTLATKDGAWFVTPDKSQSIAGQDKRILIMQLTTKGKIKGMVSLQGRTALGETWEVKDVAFESR